MLAYFCCTEHRRATVRRQTTLNGIDFLEVVDEAALPGERQRILRIHFVNQPAGLLLARLLKTGPDKLGPDNVQITGGTRVRGVRADWVSFSAADGVLTVPPDGVLTVPADGVLTVHVETPGDFSPYTLRLVETPDGGDLVGMDPLLSVVDFSFKVECPTDLDCRAERVCPPEEADAPEIDYLAKDYASFRQLMLDRLSVLAPGWTERNPADLGIALVELLAYVGDYLSYQQDAVATEAYLGTARRRTSVRRHARLLDYSMHDGCNARAWVQVRVNTDVPPPTPDDPDKGMRKGTQLFTAVGSAPPRIAPDSHEHRDALAFHPVVFETMHDVELFRGYEWLPFYTWGEADCCLPQGATRATLAGKLNRLKEGDVLVFVEELGPRTGRREDADPAHRHAVRLTTVGLAFDPLHVVDATKIEWAEEDALPFPLCLSAITDEAHGHHDLTNVSVALGNIVLADHGRTVKEELPVIPAPDPRLARLAVSAGSACDRPESVPVPPRYRPRLASAPLTMGATVARTQIVEGRRRRRAFDPDAPASAAFQWEMERVLPAIRLKDDSGRSWFPQRDLLGSDEFAPELAAEVEEDGRATLRFGDDEYGLRPASGTGFGAEYRVGNGAGGNVGAGSLRHVVALDSRIESVWNPMPARGGAEPETIEQVRHYAPSAFRVQQRAVTVADYAEVTERHRQVQRAAATMRWTGSWRTVFLTVDRVGGRPVGAGDFPARLRDHLERYRMAGHDLEINGPRFVPIELALFACALPDYYRSDVKRALLDVFSARFFPDGRRGFFHPDNFTFAQPVYLSALYAAAQAVQGVRFVEIRTFQRLGLDSRAGLDDGVLPMGRLEIARLDNDPNFPERGLLRLDVEGGR